MKEEKWIGDTPSRSNSMKGRNAITAPRFVQIAVCCAASGKQYLFGLDNAGYAWGLETEQEGHWYWFRLTTRAAAPDEEETSG